MATSKTRDIAKILGKSERANPTNVAFSISGGGGGGSSLVVYATLNDLPTSNLTTGDQAYVSENQRMYISNGSGWYNVALINATPSLTVSPSGTIALSQEGVAQIVTITAVDSDNADASLTLSVDSGGDFFKMATISQDSSVFTITPRSEDSATATGDDGAATLTFKASDGINFGTEQVSFTLGFTVENSNFTSLLMKADTAGTDNQVDASTNTHTITETGNVTSNSFTPYHPGGYSTYFSSAANRIVTNLAGSGNVAWTIEWWVYHTANSGTSSQNRNFGAATNDPIFLNTNLNTQNLYIGGQPRVQGSKTMAIGQWYHMALVRSVTSNTIKLYIDGVLEGTSSVQAGNTYNIPAKNSFGVGSDDNYSAYGMTGYIKDFRYVIGTEVYTSAFTPPTSSLTAISGTDLLLCNNPAPVDVSGNYNAVTVTGATGARVTPYVHQNPYVKADHSGSVFFDGNGDYLTWGSSGYALTGAFEVEFWFNPTSLGGTYRTIFAINSAATGYAGVRIDSRNNDASGQFKVFLDKSVGGGWDIERNIAIAVDQWYHVSVGRDASNVVRVFLNGILVGANATLAGTFSATSLNYIGCGQNGTNFYHGHVSDLRWLVGSTTRSADTSFIPPTTKLTAITNTDLLTCTNKNDIWDASSVTVLTKAGNTTASNTQRKFATSSAVAFDGTGDYISAPTSQTFDLAGSIAWTIEGWFYWSSVSGEMTLIEKFTGGNGPGWTLYKLSSGNALGFYSGSSATFSNTMGTVTTGQWYHVAVTRDAGGTTRGFLNGTLTATGTYSIGNNSTGNLYIGSRNGSSNYMNGYVQDVRITRGLARYTSNFTPTVTEHKG